ncbi:MAG: hypothetical protein GX317_12405 [Staphylococcus equorum]|nr:hypothetical protein [Staphylococcus equorum]
MGYLQNAFAYNGVLPGLPGGIPFKESALKKLKGWMAGVFYENSGGKQKFNLISKV